MRVETDAGLVGHGEVCPLGPFYLPAYAEGVRRGTARTGAASHRRRSARTREAESHDGRRAQGASVCEERHRHRVLGHPRPGRRDCRCASCSAAATATTVRPLPRHLAGVAGGDGAQGRGLSRRRLPPLPAQGRRRSRRGHRAHPRRRAKLQPGDRLVADANTGWVQHEAVRVVRAVRDVDVYIEQPCLTYEECLAVRRQHGSSVRARREHRRLDILLRGQADLAMDVVNLKISKLGGLTKIQPGARPVRQHGHRDDAGGLAGAATSRPRPSRISRTARRRSSCSPPPTSTATSPSRPPTARRSAGTAAWPPPPLQDSASPRARSS